MSKQFTITSASKADIAKIRRRLQQLSNVISSSLFKGSYVSEDALIAENGVPKEGWNYYNTVLGQTLTYHKGAWYQYTIDGENGTNSNYEGSFTVAPSDPVTDDAYYDEDDEIVYIYNGIAWEIMSQAGTGIEITYHDSDLDATPVPATGTGEADGWHLDATEDVNWIAQKVTVIGTWGVPIPAKNLVGVAGADGADAVVYYILPTDGTAIKNSTGTLTIEAHRIAGGFDTILSAGTIELFDPGDNPLGYSETFNAAAISNDIVITMKDGDGGDPLDTITLVDVTDGDDGSDGTNGTDGDDGTNGTNGSDGADGANAIVGSVESDNGLSWVQAPGGGAWSPTTLTSTLTCTFYQGGSAINTMDTVVTRTDGNLGASGATVDGITSVVTGNGTPTLTVEFTHNASGNTVSQTLYAVAGGDDGADGSNGTNGTDGDDGTNGTNGTNGTDGDDAIVYYIQPTDGTAIKNSTGTLTIEAHKITGGVDAILTTGTIELFDPANNPLGYSETFNAASITGDILITLKDGAGGTVLSTITLVDITDGDDGATGDTGATGDDGENAIVGSVESDIGLAWVRAPGPGAWSPVGTTATVTCTFYQGGSPINTMNTAVNRTDGNLSATGATVDGITSVITGSGTPTLTVEFTHNASGNTVNETLYAVEGGSDSTFIDGTQVGHWKLNDVAADTVIVDSSVNAKNGALDGSTASVLTVAGAASNTNTAIDLSLGGGDRIITVPDQSYYSFGDGAGNDEPFSVAAWVYIDASLTNRGIISKDNGSTAREWLLYVDAAHDLNLYVMNPNITAYLFEISDNPVSVGWRHIVATYDGLKTTSSIKLYIDGALSSTAPATSVGPYSGMTPTVTPLTIGGNSTGGNSLNNKIDDVRVYNRELDQAYVTLLYNGGSGTEEDFLESGTDGLDGSIVPILSGVDFQSENPTGTAVSWSQGTINFGQDEIAMSTGGNTTLQYIYWDGPSATTLSATNTLSVATDRTLDHWLVCINDLGTAYPAQATRLINAGMIVVNTLSAIKADLGTITGGSITLSGLNGSEVPAATARYQMRMDGGGIQGRWRASGDPTAWGSYRNIVDITGNEVKLSFDSFDTGETIPGVGTIQIAGQTVVFGGQATGWSRTITTRTGPVVLNSTFFRSSDFFVEHVDQGMITVDAFVDVVSDTDGYECTIFVHRTSNDALIGSTTSNQTFINASDDATIKQFDWTGVADRTFMNVGAELNEEVYLVVAMENITVGTFSITFGDSLSNEIKIDNVGLGASLVKA